MNTSPSSNTTFPVRVVCSWLLSAAASITVLLAPALWNGFAIVFFDTGGYVSRVLDMTLAPGRSIFYGLFLWLTSLGWWSFWGPVIAQSLLVLWVIHLMLRAHSIPSGPLATALTCSGLGLFTGISWYTGQLMPDILVPSTVLALWLLGFRWEMLRPAERSGLMLAVLLGMLSHMSCLALAVGLAMVTLFSGIVARGRGMYLSVRIMPSVAIVTVGLCLMPALHFLLVGKASYTPGGPVFIFGRLVQDGIAQRWLADHCPIPGIRLCDLQDRLPKTADDFLWGDGSPFRDLGGWSGTAEAELSSLLRACITTYPGMFLWTSLRATATQLVQVATGDGLDEYHQAARGVFATQLGATEQPFHAARQQRNLITQPLFDALNLIHVPIALLSTLALMLIVAWGFRARRHDLGAAALFILSALLGNAFICGALSNPHDRYQSRLVWVATLIAVMAAVAWWRQRAWRISAELWWSQSHVEHRFVNDLVFPEKARGIPNHPRI